MRAVLRTLAQCHSHHILHRDVKPGGYCEDSCCHHTLGCLKLHPDVCDWVGQAYAGVHNGCVLVCAGNFMLLSDNARAPLKAIDFGLAVPFDPDGLPRGDLGLEGTPWCEPAVSHHG